MTAVLSVSILAYFPSTVQPAIPALTSCSEHVFNAELDLVTEFRFSFPRELRTEDKLRLIASAFCLTAPCAVPEPIALVIEIHFSNDGAASKIILR